MTTGMLKVVAPPQITTPPEDQSVTEGMFVELVCETTGLPQPEVRDFVYFNTLIVTCTYAPTCIFECDY